MVYFYSERRKLRLWGSLLVGIIFLSLPHWFEALGDLEPVTPIAYNASQHYDHAVKVFHYLIPHWGDSHHGPVPCGPIYCEWVVSDHIKRLGENLLSFTPKELYGAQTLTVSVYNIHSLWEKFRDPHPHDCDIRSNLSVAESEESFTRFQHLLQAGMDNFEGFSSTSPKSSVQRVYKEALFQKNELLPRQNFSSLIKAGAYIASDCHRRDSANARRDDVIADIRKLGLRVDGLGRCMHSEGPEGVTLSRSRDTRYNLDVKRSVVGKFMFYMAFENSLEPGYVTEKPFDGLIGGSVPVYLGDAAHLKTMIPHPKAVIFVADYPDTASLVKYLLYLTTNETAYEEHRAWALTYDHQKHIAGNELMSKSWFCRMCEWAVKAAKQPRKHVPQCLPIIPAVNISDDPNALPAIHSYLKQKLGPEWEGLTLRPSNSRQVYFVKDGVLRPIPNFDTFVAMKLDFKKVKVVDPANMEFMIFSDPMPALTP